MKALAALGLCLVCQFILTACGDSKQASSPQTGAGPAAGGEFKIGDGIGTHGVSTETRTVETIKQLIADGADPQKPHMIEHHLAASSLETARAIVQWGTENGFTPTGFDEGQAVAGEWINIDLVKPTKLELDLLWHDTRLIESLAESLECEYDFWGCEVVR